MDGLRNWMSIEEKHGELVIFPSLRNLQPSALATKVFPRPGFPSMKKGSGAQ